MKKTVIKSLDQLIEIFPSLTQAQIIKLFMQAVENAKYLNFIRNENLNEITQDEILEKWGFYKDCEEFLGNYLARCYCVTNGYHLHN